MLVVTVFQLNAMNKNECTQKLVQGNIGLHNCHSESLEFTMDGIIHGHEPQVNLTVNNSSFEASGSIPAFSSYTLSSGTMWTKGTLWGLPVFLTLKLPGMSCSKKFWITSLGTYHAGTTDNGTLIVAKEIEQKEAAEHVAII